MKKRVLLLIPFLLFHLATFAQALHHTYHNNAIDVSQVLIRGHANQLLVGGATGAFQGWPGFVPYLMSVDSDGYLLWEKYFTSSQPTEIGLVAAILYDEEAAVYYVSAYESGCDYGLPSYLYQLDVQGNTNWSIQTESFSYYSTMQMMPGLGILGQSPYSPIISLINPADGALIKDHNFYDDYSLFTQDILALNDGKAAIIGNNQILLTDWLTQEVSVLAVFELEGGIGLSSLSFTESIVALTEERLYLLSESLQEEISVDITDIGAPVKMKSTEENVYVLFLEDDKYLIAQFDASLNLTNTINLGASYYRPTDFLVENNRITILGETRSRLLSESSYPGGSNGFYNNLGSDLYIQSWEMGQNTPSGVDISLEPFTFTDTTILLEEGYCGISGTGAMALEIEGIEVKITNTGSQTIQSLQLNAGNFPCAYICPATNTATYSYNGLDLAPGQSTLLPFGNYQTYFMPYDSTYEFCVWASGINDRLDDDFSNNKSCLLFAPGGIVSTKEQKQALPEWSLSPNPASSLINIQFSHPLSGNSILSIRNMTGQVLLTQSIDSRMTTIQLDISHLPKGIYTTTLLSGNTNDSRLWVRQ